VSAGVEAPEAAVVHAPVSVLPTPFPRRSFTQAVAAMPAFNSLIDRVSRDEQYLHQTLAPAAQYDDFTVRYCNKKQHRSSSVCACRALTEVCWFHSQTANFPKSKACITVWVLSMVEAEF
jgi:Eukaryotic glutathione synthase, ATP binding domain